MQNDIDTKQNLLWKKDGGKIMLLVIAEKEALGKYIAEALPGTIKFSKDGSLGRIEKGDYIVVWTNGHLLSLKDPEDIDKKYRKWKLETLPIYFENWGKKVSKGYKSQNGKKSLKELRVDEIGRLLKKASSVIHAGDIDEEGQLLVDELLDWFNYSGKVMRLSTANTAKESLQKSLQNMEDNSKYVCNGKAAAGRELADMIFGYNLSRYYTLINNSKTPLSVGRVLTAALGMVVNRDQQIEEHHKVYYFNLLVKLSILGVSVECKYIPNSENSNLTDGKFLNSSYVNEISQELPSQLNNVEIKKSIVKENPPLTFNTNKLDVFCEKAFGYSPDVVLETTQSLRDNYNAITYNRSDCQYLGDEQFAEAPKIINKLMKIMNLEDVNLIDTSIKSKCFNSEKITAHFAIIPTGSYVDLGKMSEREKNVYCAIVNRYLIQFMPPIKKEKTKLICTLSDGSAITSVTNKIVDYGFSKFLGKKDSDEVGLQKLQEGIYKAEVMETSVVQQATKPPARYSQASLAEDMTRVSKYVTDPEMKRLLVEKDKDKDGECGSIGTSATRGMIITNLIKKGFVKEEKKGKKEIIVSTNLGRKFYAMLPDNIKTAEVTARWWAIQEDIKRGNAEPADLAKNVFETVKSIICHGNALNGEKSENENNTQYKTDKIVNKDDKDGFGGLPIVGICPLCGKTDNGKLVERKGKNGVFFVCSRHPQCKYVKRKQDTPDAKCPLCGEAIGGILKKRRGKNGIFMVCSRYPTCRYAKKIQE